MQLEALRSLNPAAMADVLTQVASEVDTLNAMHHRMQDAECIPNDLKVGYAYIAWHILFSTGE
jgi:hypothetical protein